jgi:hypothetical protein
MNAQEFIKHVEEESKKQLQEILDRKNKDGLTANLILDVYRYFGSDINNTVKHLLDDETAVDYSANVYKIQCVINDKIINDLKEFEEIKQRALRNNSILDGKWEDEPIEKEYNLTRNFDEFKEDFLERLKLSEHRWQSEKNQPKNELLATLDQIRPYFFGFLFGSTFIYNHKAYMANDTIGFESVDELVNYCSNLNNCLLYNIEFASTLTAPIKISLRYGQIDE